MLFLESENKIIKEVLEGRLGEKAPRPVQPLEIRLCDFDDVQYDMSIVDNLLTVSMAYPPYKSLEGLGAKQMFAARYPEFQLVARRQVNVDVITPTNAASFIERISILKRNIMGSPFEQCFEALQNGNASTLGPVQIPYRRNETIYVLPQADRIVIVYSVCFEDKTDQAIARVFLQEFVDTRRTVNNAPPVAFGKDPPLELRGAPGLRHSPDLVGYLSLAIFPTHVDTTEKRVKAATLVQGLRNYLHYHIKASKTYLHIRMRKRVDLLLQVLNRARPEKDQSKTQKKTITGRTFARA
ncbi:Sulfatase protein [Phytophthora nicotianae]|uniref:Arp2/3 complex 34 kDa subunit n=1 Tax=Phytophthora nicotianae TaxID=4792 RepID=A0A0W8DBT4_PHYNI|nr:Sulfatase protein [Phytophthora nicotianae]